MSTFEIYFNDLNEEAKKRYIDSFGFNENHELSPLAIIEVEPEEDNKYYYYVFVNAKNGEVMTRIEAEDIGDAFEKLVKDINTNNKPIISSHLSLEPVNNIYFASGEIEYEDNTKLHLLIR